eukprot:CAMPEP_0182615604 /NCGR_PEP_ID=MMETSP1330-20130603/35390_1 /TAXON_ID=464278 /ORGANISM="Picochlorum sp., Strain RCC944" /LENGTH=205 /DNA_ID=CAMNT_0024835559 /DNA_START=71 /DNA_END=689 /DNA_ORIENTATION=+
MKRLQPATQVLEVHFGVQSADVEAAFQADRHTPAITASRRGRRAALNIGDTNLQRGLGPRALALEATASLSPRLWEPTDTLSHERKDSNLPSRISLLDGDVSHEPVRAFRLTSWKQPEWGIWIMTDLKAVSNAIGGAPSQKITLRGDVALAATTLGDGISRDSGVSSDWVGVGAPERPPPKTAFACRRYAGSKFIRSELTSKDTR